MTLSQILMNKGLVKALLMQKFPMFHYMMNFYNISDFLKVLYRSLVSDHMVGHKITRSREHTFQRKQVVSKRKLYVNKCVSYRTF